MVELEGAATVNDGDQNVDKGETRSVSQQTVEITDKTGEKFSVTYIRSNDGTPVIQTPEAQAIVADLAVVAEAGFPDIDASNINDKFASSNAIDIVRAADGTPVGLHTYKFSQIDVDGTSVKTMYTSFAVIIPSHNGRQLTERSRLPAIDIENPDIIAGSTNVPAIFRTNANIAAAKGMELYPRDVHTPAPIVDLGNRVLNTIMKSPHPADQPPLVGENLVRTRRPLQDGEQHIPFFDSIVPIGPHQQLLYVLVKPEVHARVMKSTTPQASLQA